MYKNNIVSLQKISIMSLRKDILNQIEIIDVGRIFTSHSLSFDACKIANVNVLLSELVKKGHLKRIGRGAYYKFEMSKYGLGPKPVYEAEKIRYLSFKFGGYASGAYIFNLMGLTEQVPSVVTIAVPHPVREFVFGNVRVNSMKSYVEHFCDEEIKYLRVLDAVREMKHIPGRTAKDVYKDLRSMFFEKYSEDELKVLIGLALHYPPGVRMMVYTLLESTGNKTKGKSLLDSVNANTRKTFYNSRLYEITRG